MTRWVVEGVEGWAEVVEAPTPGTAAQKYGDGLGMEGDVSPSYWLNEGRTDNTMWFDVCDQGGNLVDNYRVEPYTETQ